MAENTRKKYLDFLKEEIQRYCNDKKNTNYLGTTEMNSARKASYPPMSIARNPIVLI